MMRAKLSTRNLGKSFRKGATTVEVLRDLDIDIYPGEFVTIVGASGCGKTTFLRLVDGLIEPSQGSVAIDGEAVDKPGDRIAFVFQQDGLFPWRTVTHNAALGPEIQGKDGGAARRIADQYLRLVGLGGFNRHYPHELSGGMRQRVNIARALSAGADVLLMDEPFAALDAQTREIMQSELLRIWQETGKTVLLVTHQIDEAVYLSDRVLIFTVRPGRLKQELKIELPRPRDLAIKRTAEFVRYTDQIWRAIEEEVRDSIGREAQDIAASHAD
jgi:ABC-type nitrate/sulfonate/bicarbonate transport system ATPase subunit